MTPSAVPTESPPQAALHLLVRGMVQGVGFRQGMVSTATGLGVRGWVRNRSDGSVEAVVQGDAPACEALARWAQRGPLGAQVRAVERRPASAAETADLQAHFAWRPTL
jgi:acylphosphatase